MKFQQWPPYSPNVSRRRRDQGLRRRRAITDGSGAHNITLEEIILSPAVSGALLSVRRAPRAVVLDCYFKQL